MEAAVRIAKEELNRELTEDEWGVLWAYAKRTGDISVGLEAMTHRESTSGSHKEEFGAMFFAELMEGVDRKLQIEFEKRTLQLVKAELMRLQIIYGYPLQTGKLCAQDQNSFNKACETIKNLRPLPESGGIVLYHCRETFTWTVW